ncbi:diguanylate cyclase domain-containing protein [Pseudoalteromonas fenneropenaei]|uniref:Diguanylate cyclase domain-containing protein n=1 Tax=Pseudoalteromonas fenneropenaei TaxID=1737459 RepID=A0ABV7CPT4_9GAMM
MMNSISRKLTLLFVSTALLLLMISFALWNIAEEQHEAKLHANEIIKIHKKVDFLHGQLWMYLQYKDKQSLQRVSLAQQELNALLNQFLQPKLALSPLIRLNGNLAMLLAHEVTLTQLLPVEPDFSDRLAKAQLLLHSRYNILMEDMSEALLDAQKQLARNNAAQQHQTLFFTALSLIVFAILVSIIALFILKRVRGGFYQLTDGIARLSQGDLDSRIVARYQDEEFATVIKAFNRMKASLQKTTVTKQHLAQEVAAQTALLEQQKAKLTFLSERDPLTGIYNRRAFSQELERTIAMAQRAQLQFALLFFDLDKFKAINDTYGHPAGDAILVEIARRLQHNIRKSDFCGRIGGDEFVVCLNLEKDFSGVADKAEQLVNKLTRPIFYEQLKLEIDVSIGISLYPNEATTQQALLHLADTAMYKAKALHGSHCFCHHLHTEPKRLA